MADERKVKVVLQADIANYRRAMADADKATARAATDIDRHGNKITSAGTRMVRSAEVNREAWQTAGTALLGFGAIGVATLGLSAKAAVDWESAWTGVLKTVEGTPDELMALEESLRAMALRMPASATEIAGVAEAAGQLGVKVNDVAKFTETMVMLGETTNLSADEAAIALARFSNIMGTATSDADKLGSVIVDLGNNSATTEAEIVDFGLRLAAAGKQAGLTEGQVLAFGATLSSLGVRAEAGGTAMSKVFYSISDAVLDGGDTLQTYAKIAGVSADDFVKAYGQDAAAAIALFVAGLGDITDAGGSTTELLKDLELTDSRLRASLSATASAGGLLESSLERQNIAWEENRALLDEAEKRYKTTASQVAVARNSINEAAITIGENLLPVLAALATGVTDAMQAFSLLPEPLQNAIIIFGGATTALALLTGLALKGIPAYIDLQDSFRKVAAASTAMATGIRVASIATGILGAGLAVASIVFGVFASRNAEAEQRVGELADTLDTATGAMTDLTRETVYNNLVNSGATEAAKKLGVELNVLTDAALGNADAQALVNAAIEEGREKADQGADGVRNAVEANSEWIRSGNVLRDAIGGQNEELEAARQAWADEQVAMKRAGDESEQAAGAMASLEGIIVDTTGSTEDFNEALTDALELMRDAAGVAMSELDALSSYEQAIDDATASIKDNGKNLDLNTQKGRDNQAALLDIATATWDWVDAGNAAGVGVDDLAERMKTGREQFIRTAEKMGLTRNEAKALADQLGLIPSDVTTAVEVTGISEAQAKIDAWIAGNSRKTIRIATDVYGGGGITRADGGPIYGPGTSRSDSIPVWASNGEYMQNAAAHSYWGTSMMDALNSRDLAGVWRALSARGYATGGAIVSAGNVARASSTPAGAPGPVMARLHPADIQALGEYILDGSKRMARGEVERVGLNLAAGVR